MGRIFLLTFIFLSGFTQLPDYPKRIIFNHLDDKNGLPSNTVNGICIDDFGFVWIATTEGLCKFDGVNLQVFGPEKGNPYSFSHANALGIEKANNGNLLIGSENWLNIYNYQDNKFYRCIPDQATIDKYGLSPRVSAPKTNDKGLVWLISRAMGLTFYNTNDSTYYNIGGKNSSNPTDFDIKNKQSLIDDQDSYWVISRKESMLHRVDYNEINYQDIDKTPIHRYPLEVTENKLSGRVANIYQDSGNNIWFLGEQISIMTPELRKSNAVKTIKKEELKSYTWNNWNLISEDPEGNIWIGSTFLRKVVVFNKDQEVIKVWDANTPGLEDLKDEELRFVEKGFGNSMWLGTPKALMKIDYESEKIVKFENNPSDFKSFSGSVYTNSSLQFDESGTGWITTDQKGVDFFNEKKSKFRIISNLPGNKYNLPKSTISGISKDKDGLLWLSSVDNGINVIDRKNEVYKNFDNSESKLLHTQNINNILAGDNQEIWVGHYGLERFKYDSRQQKIIPVAAYFPTDGGESALPSWYVPCFYKSKDGKVWFGTSSTLSVFNPPTSELPKGSFKSYGLDENHPIAGQLVWNISEDKEGNLWTPTSGGVSKINPTTDEITNYYHDQNDSLSMSSSNAKFVLQDKKGRIWIATESAGLNMMREDGKSFTRFTKEDGLPSNIIWTMALDEKGNIWMGTSRGISKLNPETFEFRNFDETDGLQGMQFRMGSFYNDKINNLIYFGGDNGVTVFNPDEIEDSNFEPNVYLTSFKIFGEEVKTGHEGNAILDKNIHFTSGIELHYDQNTFSFDFASVDYAAPESIKYAYKLEGFDNNWTYQEATKRYANYTNLDPGEYKFLVKATNSDGIWSSHEIELPIVITPPWWATWWFRTFLVSSIILLSVIFYKWRVSRLKAQKARLEEQVEERTKNLKQANEEIYTQNEELQQQSEELQMQRDTLSEANLSLEKANLSISEQKEILENFKHSITESINYALRIQKAILPSKGELDKSLDEYFVMFRPKDVVSGDFYWSQQVNGRVFIAAVDCTGHGVPGAFMSMIGSSLLNRIVLEMKLESPAKILSALDRLVIRALRQETSENKDGMEMVIACLEKKGDETEIVMSGAKNPLYYHEAGKEEVVRLRGDRFGIGGVGGNKKVFTDQKVKLEKGGSLYLITDGVIDQHTQNRMRFGSKRLVGLLKDCRDKDMEVQKSIIEGGLDEYMNGEKQRDDITMIGIKV